MREFLTKTSVVVTFAIFAFFFFLIAVSVAIKLGYI